MQYSIEKVADGFDLILCNGGGTRVRTDATIYREDIADKISELLNLDMADREREREQRPETIEA